MQRILIILALAVLLLQGRPPNKGEPTRPSAISVTAIPLPLDSSDPERTMLGPLRWLGGWTLTSAHREFGGISSMLASDDGRILALSDSGVLFGFPAPGASSAAPGRSFIAPLPIRPEEQNWPQWKWDSESLAHDGASDSYWVGFELIQRVCRYSSALARVESCASPPALAAWSDTESVESMVRLSDGRFLLFSEGQAGPEGGLEVLLFHGDPAEPTTPAPIHLSYTPPQGFRPTDAVALNDRTLLLLNRRATVYELFTAELALVPLPPVMDARTMLKAQPIAHFAAPIATDNMEAMALSREHGRRILWLASDDNHEFFQRSLLLKFALPAGW